MTARLVTAPATLPVTAEQVKENARIDHGDENGLIEGLIRAALAHAEAWCDRAFEMQTWEEAIGSFPVGAIRLTRGPVASIVSVKYDDADGVEQTIDPSEYGLDGHSVAHFTGWPTARDRFNSVRIQYVVGGSSPDDVKQAILLMATAWYENRSDLSADAPSEIPMGSKAILSLHQQKFV